MIGTWLLVLVAVLGSAATFGGTLSDTFTLPGTDSQEAADLLTDRFPEFSGSSATVVVAGEDLRSRGPELASLVAALGQVGDVTSVSDPAAPGAMAMSGDVLRLDVSFPTNAQEGSDESFAELEAVVESARGDGMQVEVGGEVATAKTREEPGGPAEAIGLMVAIAVLALSFGQVRAMGLTLANALLGVAVSVGTVLLIARFVDIPSVAEVLGVMIGLAVGIDYALFIVSHRQHLGEGMDVTESLGRALATAGGAVVFAGSTVVIAMGGLLIVGIPFISLMALAVVLAVVLAVTVSMTLLPALLAVAGPRIATVTLPVLRNRAPTAPQDTIGARWARWVTRRPWLSFGAGFAVIAVLSIPLVSIDTGMPNDGSAPSDTSRRAAYDLIEQGFGAGFNAPLLIVVDHADLGAGEAQEALTTISAAVADDPDILLVAPPQTNGAATQPSSPRSRRGGRGPTPPSP